MKKINKSSSAPQKLTHYIASHPVGTPLHTWKFFSSHVQAKKSVQKQLRKDQKGLCAYCEIDLSEVPSANTGNTNIAGQKLLTDFRVEHFHPSSDTSNPNVSWHLKWENLLATCAGGSETNLYDSSRIAKSKKSQHCDVPKSDQILDGVILNPLQDIPAFPCLFSYKKTNKGIMLLPNQAACNAHSQDSFQKAKNTIKELNLNCDLLMQFREKAIESLIAELKKINLSIEEAMPKLMKMVFDDTAPQWPPFFTTVRAYFGKTAEIRLCQINYNG